MLPKNKRLRRESFEAILGKPGLRSVYNQLGTLKFVPSATKRFSIVTSGKHEKSAVKRNRTRRRIYSLFVKQKANIDGILYVSKISYKLDFDSVKKYFEELVIKTKKNS